MKILMINSVCGIRSTGRICTDLAEELEKQGHEVKIAYGRETVPEKYSRYAVRIGTGWGVRMNALSCRMFDNDGFAAKRATKRFLKWAEGFDPDVLWLHNLHGYYINTELLFAWIRSRPDMRVKWTLHDCWAFTGHCAHFTAAGCGKWKTHCHHCPEKKRYPASYVLDASRRNFDRKKAAFTGVRNMMLITPSEWLADLAGQSFLKEYPVEVHRNTVDTSVFCPTPGDFRERYGLVGKKIVLGVANVWNARKGYGDFIRLAKMLDERYVIVLVGLSGKQIKDLPKGVLGIQRTNSPRQLAQIYTAADVFVNPTYEDNYPTVNLEAQACGTPVITYRTGGSPETLSPGKGAVVEAGDVVGLRNMILALYQ